jgi:hypothetical protein
MFVTVHALLSVTNRHDRVSLCRRATLSVLLLFREALPAELRLHIARLVFASRGDDVSWGRLRFPVACGPLSPAVEISRLFGPGFAVFSVSDAAWLDPDQPLAVAGVGEGDELLVQPRYVRLSLRWGGNCTQTRFTTSDTVAAVKREVRRISGRQCQAIVEEDEQGGKVLSDCFPLALLDDLVELQCVLRARGCDVFS